MLAVFVGTSVFGEVKGWLRERDAVTPWAVALEQSSKDAERKDQITALAIQETERATNEIQELRASLDAAEIARKLAKAPDCVWSDDDLRLLNDAKAARRRPSPGS
jgi:hypothetical protein